MTQDHDISLLVNCSFLTNSYVVWKWGTQLRSAACEEIPSASATSNVEMEATHQEQVSCELTKTMEDMVQELELDGQ